MIGKLLEEGIERLRQLGFGVYFDHGAETGRVLKINRDYLDSLTLEMRLIDSKPANTEIQLFGRTFSTPIMTGALSGLGKICPNPLVEIARGVAAAGSAIWVGIGDSDELQAVIDTGAPTVKIVKPYRDNDLIFSKILDAEKRGAVAVGMDIDFFYGGKRGDNLIRANLMGPKTLQEIKEYIKATKLPFIIKGVLSVQDAVKAVEAGAGAIVVSHHGGAVLDYAVPPLKILPKIAKAIGGAIPIFVDSGLVRGTDVFKVLALGADAVLMGRVVMAALAAGGAEGVRKMIEGLTEELRRVMSLTGSSSLKDIDPEVVWP